MLSIDEGEKQLNEILKAQIKSGKRLNIWLKILIPLLGIICIIELLKVLSLWHL